MFTIWKANTFTLIINLIIFAISWLECRGDVNSAMQMFAVASMSFVLISVLLPRAQGGAGDISSVVRTSQSAGGAAVALGSYLIVTGDYHRIPPVVFFVCMLVLAVLLLWFVVTRSVQGDTEAGWPRCVAYLAYAWVSIPFLGALSGLPLVFLRHVSIPG